MRDAGNICGLSMSVKQLNPLGLDPQFERVVAATLCARPKFFALVGDALDSDGIGNEPARNAIKAAKAVAKDNGHGPSDPVLVVQRMRRWLAEGKATQAEIDAVVDLLEATSASTNGNDLAKELVPVLRRRAEGEAVRAMIDDYGKRGDLVRPREMLEAAARVGSQDSSLGQRLGNTTFAAIARLRHMDRLASGIMELDIGLNGGMPRGCFGAIMGSTGSGKSMYLNQQSVFCLWNGQHVAYATLELQEELVKARLVAAITGISTNAIVAGSDHAEALFNAALPRLGVFRTKWFASKKTTATDLISWVGECEQEEGRKVDLLIVDLVDKLGAVGREKNDYGAQGDAVEELRNDAIERGSWVWSAVHSKFRDAKDRKKKLDAEDSAGSKDKVRNADMVITIQVSDGEDSGEPGDLASIHVAKNRNGPQAFTVGPLPTNYAAGQLISVPHNPLEVV